MAPLRLFPAIDVREGRCVRLLRGDYAQETVYGDPLDQARRYVAAGAPALHLVDLDAARTGVRENRSVIDEILREVAVPVQVGGGIRSQAMVEELLAAGADRVVLGTAAIEDAGLGRRLAVAFPGRIVVGLDHRASPAGGREVALRGWEAGSGVSLRDAVAALAGSAVAALVVTEISRDGSLAGPDLEGYTELLAATELPLVASGGVANAGDLRALAALEASGRRLEGVIVGRALLAGALTLEEALAACAR